MAAVGAIVFGVWGTHFEPDRLLVEERVLSAAGATQPLLIGVIADLQTPNIGDYENNARDRVLAAEPDVVVLPGDLYQLAEADLEARLPEFLGWIRELRSSVDDVVLVNGTVDDPEVLAEIADETGIHFLNDELLTLDIAGQDVTFVGLSVQPDEDESQISPLVTAALVEATRSSDLVIAVGNDPDTVLSYPTETTIDLTISGGTHGGQVALPVIRSVFARSDLPAQVAAGGLHLLNDHPLYVSTGVGIEREQAPQLRFRVRPSVGLLTVVPPDS